MTAQGLTPLSVIQATPRRCYSAPVAGAGTVPRRCYTRFAMRRRWIVALVLATALVFSLAGTAVGYWVLPEGKGESASCIILRNQIQGITWAGEGRGDAEATEVVNKYDAECR